MSSTVEDPLARFGWGHRKRFHILVESERVVFENGNVIFELFRVEVHVLDEFSKYGFLLSTLVLY